MNQPERLKTARGSDAAGQLLSSGSQERPNPEAMRRAAQRLGISAAALTYAAATAIATEAAAAVSSAVAGGVVSAGAVVGKTAGSLLAASIIKGTLIGLGITIAAYSGVQLVDAGIQSSALNSTSIPKQSSQQPQLKATDPIVIPTPSVLQGPQPTPLKVQPAAPSSASPAKALVAAPPRKSAAPPIFNAAPTARFEDPEPPALLPSHEPAVTDETQRLGAVAPAAATPSAVTAPPELRLMREVASLDRARLAANRGAAATALRELTTFEHDYGYVTLRKEAMLVNIDVLLSLGRKAEAITLARRLLALGAPATQRAKLEGLVDEQP